MVYTNQCTAVYFIGMSLTEDKTYNLRSSTTEDVVELCNDPEKFVNYVSNPESDLSVLAKSDNANLFIMKLLQQIIITNQETNEKLVKSNNRVAELEEKCAELSTRLSHQHERVQDLSSRVLLLEQYSRRSTVTVTGVPYESGENVEDKIVKIINNSHIIKHDFDSTYISNAHRNKPREGKDGKPPPPPSITVSLVKSADVDMLLSNKKQFKKVHGANKINIFYSMSAGTRDQKLRMEMCQEVEFADWQGHSRLFAVKMRNGKFLRKVRGFADLESKVGELTLPAVDDKGDD